MAFTREFVDHNGLSLLIGGPWTILLMPVNGPIHFQSGEMYDGSRSRMLQEESHHLPRRVRPAGIGERTLSAADGPSMAAAMRQPVLGQHPSLGGAVQASRVVAPADSALTVDFGGGIRLRGARADHVLAVGGMQPLALARA
jgi:hypothetical protein